MKIIKRITVWLFVVLTFVQSPLVYAQESATPSAIPVITSSPQSTPSATPSPFLDQPEATGSATGNVLLDIPVSSISAAMTTPTPTLEMLTGPSGVLTSSASIKGPPRIRPLTKHAFRAGDVASVVVENVDMSALRVTVKNHTGEVMTSTPSLEPYDGGIRVTFIPKTSAKPGKYTIVVEDTTTGVTTTQDFLWGVLAFNTDQATYNPGDIADIALAVLDEDGKMVCNADVTLTILSPARNITTLKTSDGTIRVTPACSVHDYTLTPDYETSFRTSDEGVYQVLLTATTKNGTYAIQDSFQVSSDMPFQVKRESATRIYPPKPYPMTIDVTANEDFSGTVTETVPENFTITSLSGSVPYADVKTIVPVPESQIPIQLGMPFEGNYPVTLGFGDRIKDPKIKSLYEQNGLKGHDGADFAMPVGTVVLAADSGTVSRIADNPYGTTVVIDHSWGRSYYGHLSVVQVKEGDTVGKGAPIALSGNTGLTTGAHLHFGMKLTKNDINNGYYGKIDPMPYLTSSVVYQADGSGKQISWNVNIKTGEKIRLGYTYKAPEVSPQFYLVGPLTFNSSAGTAPAPAPVPGSPFVLGVATDSAKPSVSVSNSITYQEPRRWQIAADAAPNLDLIVPTAYSSTTGTAYTTTTATNIDENISSPDGAFIVSGANSTATIFYDITDTPADFVKMKTLNYNVRYRLVNINDTEVLSIQIFKSDGVTPLTNKMQIVSLNTNNTTLTNSGVVAFTGVSTTATKAEWDTASVAIYTAHTKSGSSDGSVWYIDTVNITGTYDAPPTVSLTTPTDGATGQSTTPALVFTGTDANSDAIEYNVQVDTVNTFNSFSGLGATVTKTLASGENMAFSMTQDTDYVYVGLNTSPAKVVRINKSDFSTTVTKTLASGEDYASSVTQDTNYVYVGTYTIPAKVVRINKSDFSTTVTKTLASGENYALSMTQDTDYVYVATNTVPAKVVRITKSDFSTTVTKTLATGEDNAYAITQDTNYVYVTTYTAPAKVVRINKSDFSTTVTKTLATGEDDASSMTQDTDYVYVGTNTFPAKVVRITKSDFSTTVTKTLASGEDKADGITQDTNYVYVGTGTSPIEVVRITKSDFSTTVTKTLASGEDYTYSMVQDTNYVYVGTDNQPAKVVRISLFAPLLDVNSVDNVGFSGTGGTTQWPSGNEVTYTVNGPTIPMKYIDMWGVKVGAPADNITITVHDTSITGTTLGISDPVAASSFPLTADYVRFTFATPITLTSNTKYYMEAKRSGARDTSNYTSWYYSTGNAYSGGGSYVESSGSWSAESSNQDFTFAIYDNNTRLITTNDWTDSLGNAIFGASGSNEEEGQSFTVPDVDDTLTAGLTYYWRVRAKDPLGTNTWGAWSPGSGSLGYQSFTTASGGGPTTDQQMRHGTWFSNGVKQGFTF